MTMQLRRRTADSRLVPFACRDLRLLLSVLLFTSIVAAQPDRSVWRYVDPDSTALIGLNWKRVAESSIGKILERNVGSLPFPLPSTDFLKDVERIIVASRSDPGQEQPPLLIVVRGHFQQAQIRKALLEHGAKKQAYGPHTIYRPQGSSHQALGIVLPDSETILAGDLISLCAAIDRSSSPSAIDGPTVLRAIALDSAYAAWLLATPPASLGDLGLFSFLVPDINEDSVQGLEATMSLQDGLSLRVNLATASELDAKALARKFSKAFKVVPSSLQKTLTKGMHVSATGNTASIFLRLSPNELEKRTEVIESSFLKRTDSIQEPAPTPPRPQRQVIRIEGLDEGPREIPVSDH